MENKALLDAADAALARGVRISVLRREYTPGKRRFFSMRKNNLGYLGAALAGLALLTFAACEAPPAPPQGEATIYGGESITGNNFTAHCVAERPKPVEPPPTRTPDVILMQGETAHVSLPETRECFAPLSVPGITTAVYEYAPVTTTQPSFAGARVGEYLDALLPCEGQAPHGVWLEVTAARDASPGLRVTDAGVVLVLPVALPERPTLPFYAELNPDTVSSSADNVAARAPVVRKWSNFLRAHHIEPIKQWFGGTFPPADLDAFKSSGADHDSIVIAGAIAPPMVVRYEPGRFPTDAQFSAYRQALLSGRWPADAWVYLKDEGQREPGGLAELQARSAHFRARLPELQLWATWEELPEVRPLLDGTWPVLSWFKNPAPEHPKEYTKPYGLYTSNMAHLGVRPDGTPMSVIEAPEIHLTMFPVAAWALGAKRALYYSVTERLNQAWMPGAQWWYLGNGDGTALYKHPVTGEPVASVRLKYWRNGQVLVEYLRELGPEAPKLVESPTTWEKDLAKVRAVKVRLAKKLGAL